ncbi:MAG: hypothetical protein WD770_09565 [Actinomycetota bacterium]
MDEERPPRLRRILEIALIGGSFVAASVLGGLAVAGSPPTGGSSAPATPGRVGPLRDAGQILACLRGSPDYFVVAPELPAAPGGEAFAVEPTDGGGLVHVFVFPTEAGAAGYEEEFVGSGPTQTVAVLVRNALIVFPDDASSAVRGSLEACVTGEPPPVGAGGGGDDDGTADPLEACLLDAGFETEDITDVYPDPVRSLRLTRGDELAFVFVFDSEEAAAEFEASSYGSDRDLVTNLGTVIVEYGEEPPPETETDVEGCAALA